jgi:hypothetical protein
MLHHLLKHALQILKVDRFGLMIQPIRPMLITRGTAIRKKLLLPRRLGCGSHALE